MPQEQFCHCIITMNNVLSQGAIISNNVLYPGGAMISLPLKFFFFSMLYLKTTNISHKYVYKHICFEFGLIIIFISIYYLLDKNFRYSLDNSRAMLQ